MSLRPFCVPADKCPDRVSLSPATLQSVLLHSPLSRRHRAKRRALFSDPPRVTILLGDQADTNFWDSVAKDHSDGFDIILDDGGVSPHPSFWIRRGC